MQQEKILVVPQFEFCSGGLRPPVLKSQRLTAPRERRYSKLSHYQRVSPVDNGVWLATTVEHHASLVREFPNMRSIKVLGKPVTGWQVLPADAADFEEAALHACELILA